MDPSPSCPYTHIVITGPMGAGKTTVGRELARRLDRPFYDSDEQIIDRYGENAAVLAAEHGVGWLHSVEAAALEAALASPDRAVVAAAASIADRPDLDRILDDDQLVVLLDGRPEVLVERAGEGDHRRPVTDAAYRALTEDRKEALARHVDLTVDVTSVPPGAVVERILDFCERLSA